MEGGDSKEDREIWLVDDSEDIDAPASMSRSPYYECPSLWKCFALVGTIFGATAAAIHYWSDIKGVMRRSFERHDPAIVEDFRLMYDDAAMSVLDIADGDVDEAAKGLKEDMETCIELSVPLEADPKIGDNFAETK